MNLHDFIFIIGNHYRFENDTKVGAGATKHAVRIEEITQYKFDKNIDYKL